MTTTGHYQITSAINSQWRIQGFPEGGSPIPDKIRYPIIWYNFCWKMHKNEKKIGLGIKNPKTSRAIFNAPRSANANA